MAADFEMDVGAIVAWAKELTARLGLARAQRIIKCARPHYPGVSCVCGWLDDPRMPTPDVKEAPPPPSAAPRD